MALPGWMAGSGFKDGLGGCIPEGCSPEVSLPVEVMVIGSATSKLLSYLLTGCKASQRGEADPSRLVVQLCAGAWGPGVSWVTSTDGGFHRHASSSKSGVHCLKRKFQPTASGILSPHLEWRRLCPVGKRAHSVGLSL